MLAGRVLVRVLVLNRCVLAGAITAADARGARECRAGDNPGQHKADDPRHPHPDGYAPRPSSVGHPRLLLIWHIQISSSPIGA
jgi:hypothetical protein